MKFSVDKQRRVRTAVGTGVITDADLIDAYTQLISRPDYDPTLNDLVDLSQVERLDVSAATVRRLVALFSRFDSQTVSTRLAIVATGKAAFGMARMYELLRTDAPEEIRVFTSLASARKWLGLDQM